MEKTLINHSWTQQNCPLTEIKRGWGEAGVRQLPTSQTHSIFMATIASLQNLYEELSQKILPRPRGQMCCPLLRDMCPVWQQVNSSKIISNAWPWSQEPQSHRDRLLQLSRKQCCLLVMLSYLWWQPAAARRAVSLEGTPFCRTGWGFQGREFGTGSLWWWMSQMWPLELQRKQRERGR